jgi:hypothetical protein
MNITNMSSGISYTSGGGLYGLTKNVDWSKIPTKDYNSPPPSDIRSMVKQNARQYANATTEEEKARLKKEAEALFHKYVSHAAPDRKKLLSGAQTAIAAMGGNSQLVPQFTRSKNAIDYFIEAQIKKGNIIGDINRIKEISFDGGSVTKESNGRYTVKLGGEAAISINGSSIKFIPSGAELTSQKEIVDFWNQNIGSTIVENQARGYSVDSKFDVKT